MATEKDTKKQASESKQQPSGGFDLFQTFRHPPKMPEPLRQQKLPVKPKG